MTKSPKSPGQTCSRADEAALHPLVAGTHAQPPFDIVRSACVELHVTDLDASRRFYSDLLGLRISASEDDALYLRGWEERQHHSIVLRQAGVAAAACVAFRVRSEDDLDALAKELTAQGLPTEWRQAPRLGLARTLRAWDPFGEPLEFFCEMEQTETVLQRFDLHRGAPIMRFDHFNLHTPDVEAALAFWLGLGFRCSEYITAEEPYEPITGAWLLRKPSVHDVALTAGRGPRLHHIGLTVAEPLGVLRACDQLAAAGQAHAIERGPGRHGVSNAFFVYLRDPDGHRVELYACDYYTGDPDLRPLHWSASDPSCRCFWGAQAPDSWYEQSTTFLARGGDALATHASAVDERASRTQIMA